MKRGIVALIMCGTLFFAPLTWADEEDELNQAFDTIQALVVETVEVEDAIATIDSWFSWGRTCDTVDIYDIFVRSLLEVELVNEDIQFFVDRLPEDSRVFVQTATDGTKIYTFLTNTQFGCIAKILPAVPGVSPELYMHIENCQMSRHRKNGTAVTNYITSIVEKDDGTIVKQFNSTATWTFTHVDDLLVTTSTGMEFSDIWLVETIVINTPGPSMVQYYTVEDVGIVGKRKAVVSW